MDNRSITQQPKPDPKGKAITSLILGIISMFPLVVGFAGLVLLRWVAEDFYWKHYNVLPLQVAFAIFFMSPIAFLSGVVGLILGKIGLKSSRKKLAISGIILSILGLGGSIFFLGGLLMTLVR